MGGKKLKRWKKMEGKKNLFLDQIKRKCRFGLSCKKTKKQQNKKKLTQSCTPKSRFSLLFWFSHFHLIKFLLAWQWRRLTALADWKWRHHLAPPCAALAKPAWGPRQADHGGLRWQLWAREGVLCAFARRARTGGSCPASFFFFFPGMSSVAERLRRCELWKGESAGIVAPRAQARRRKAKTGRRRTAKCSSFGTVEGSYAGIRRHRVWNSDWHQPLLAWTLDLKLSTSIDNWNLNVWNWNDIHVVPIACWGFLLHLKQTDDKSILGGPKR